MKSRNYEFLDLLLAAINRSESVLLEIKHKKEKTIYLSEVLEDISRAKRVAPEKDRETIENFENELEKLHEKKATNRNYQKLERLYLHFAAEIYMAKATIDYSTEEYNTFLKLLEVEEIRNYVFAVWEGKEGTVGQTHFEVMMELDLLEKKNDKVTLTKRGGYFVKALNTLRSLTKYSRAGTIEDPQGSKRE